MATTVAQGLNELLHSFPLTQIQQDDAKKKVSDIKAFLGSEFVMAEGAITVGSYARGSIIRTERDLDILAPLHYPTYRDDYDNDSQGFLYMVRDALNAKYGSTKVSSKRVAVKLDFSTIAIDVVPCFQRQGGGYSMPNGSGGWMATNPPFHTSFMAEANTKHNKYLRPIVKFMKFWNATNGHHLSSLHVELIVERIWQNGDLASQSYSELVCETLRCMPSWVRTNFPDPWPSGQAIDKDLSSTSRDLAIRMLEEDAENARMAEAFRKNGEIEKAFERWNVIFRKQFPAYG